MEYPTEIGPYRIEEVLGHGGMGVVYRAQQLSPVSRQVALKVVRADVADSEFLHRFERERQALALMDHPGVAKVFDAGTTDDGRPYLAMELVAGRSITEFCDEQRLGIRERIELYIELCFAVQHAHQKGLVHRDLKPSNVLVAMVDGRPRAKVIDFGIATPVSGALVDETRLTA